MSQSLIDHQVDAETKLADPGAVTSSAAAQVGGSPRVLDVGPGQVQARIAVHVAAVTVAEVDQLYGIEIQLGNNEDFDDEVVVAGVLPLGHADATGSSANSAPGFRELGVRNVVGGKTFPFIRLFTRVAGAGTPSISYEAWLILRALHP